MEERMELDGELLGAEDLAVALAAAVEPEALGFEFRWEAAESDRLEREVA